LFGSLHFFYKPQSCEQDAALDFTEATLLILHSRKAFAWMGLSVNSLAGPRAEPANITALDKELQITRKTIYLCATLQTFNKAPRFFPTMTCGDPRNYCHG